MSSGPLYIRQIVLTARWPLKPTRRFDSWRCVVSLAARIRELRLKSGDSLQDVADAIGVSKTHIWELEKGRSQNPSVELLVKLADHFKVTIASLVGEDMDANGADEQLVRMFRQAGELDEYERGLLDTMIRDMLKRRKARDAPD